jgi:Transposase
MPGEEFVRRFLLHVIPSASSRLRVSYVLVVIPRRSVAVAGTRGRPTITHLSDDSSMSHFGVYEPVLTKSRWCILKKRENLPETQTVRLNDWCTRANRSGIEPMKRMAKMLERHEPLLLNWFEARGLSSGIVEGFNNKAKLTVRKP